MGNDHLTQYISESGLISVEAFLGITKAAESISIARDGTKYRLIGTFPVISTERKVIIRTPPFTLEEGHNKVFPRLPKEGIDPGWKEG